MSHFSELEIAYMHSQKLGRLATIDKDGAPNVVPVVFKYNSDLDTIDIHGHQLSSSKKFKNIQRDGRVSFVIDDVLPPWEARGIEIRGTAEGLMAEVAAETLIRVHASHIIAWGIDTAPYVHNSRKASAG